jgi:hypothetical protein
MAEILLSKEAVARRQIDAAIRMLFLHDEDLCAIYTVAAAALSVIGDLAEAKGVGPTYESRRVFEAYYRQNYNLDPTDPDVAKEIELRVKSIEKHETTRRHRDKSANFLKHADKDARGLLDSARFTTAGSYFIATNGNPKANSMSLGEVIILAINYYVNLKLPITIEMDIYRRWWLGITAAKTEDIIRTKEGPIHLFTFEQQIEFARGLLNLAYEHGL